MARPGIMLYFDILEPIRALPDSDKGRLLVAMLEYGQSGKVPQFNGELGLTLAWGFVKPKIDKDEAEYNMSVLRRQYATTCRDRKKKGEPEITFDEWLKIKKSHDDQKASMMINDDQWYPTTTTSTSTNTTITTAAAASTNEDEDGGDGLDIDSQVQVIGGTLGKNVVFLSDAQMNDLLDKMDLETFNHYVDKLSNFIIKNDARVKNHYETILKWWRQDGKIQR